VHRFVTPVGRAFDAWLAAERGRFFLFLPVCMGSGVIAYFSRRSEPAFWPAALFALLLLVPAIRLPHRPILRALFLAALFAAAGFACARFEAWRAPPWPDLPRGAVVVTGRVTAIEALPEGRRITIANPTLDAGAPLSRAVRLRLRDTDEIVLTEDDSVRVRALLRPPSAPAYPGGWDMQRDAWFAGMAAYGFAIGPATRLQAGGGGTWQTLRETVATRITTALPGARGAIAATLLTGLGAAIPPVDRAAFQASGLAHLLAVAGLHIGIVMGLVFGTMRLLLTLSEHAALHWPAKRIAAVAALGGGLLYLALTGAHVPILRSFAMACLVTLALLTGRRAISPRTLAVAALVLMAGAPSLVMGVSFQMSFAAVLALVAGWEVVAPRLATLGAGRWWRMPALSIGGLALTSGLAGTASLPYAAYHFGSAMLFYVPANMLAVPVTALWVMPWGMASLALMPFGLERWALAPMGLGIDVISGIARAVAAWPNALLPVPVMPPWGLLLLSAGLAWLCLWRSRPRLLGVVPLLAGLGSPWLAAAPDLLVSADARVIAVRAGGQVLVSLARGADAFDRAAAARVWGVAELRPMPPPGDDSGGAVHCDIASCRMTLHGARAVLLTDPAADCAGAAAVASAMPLHGRCTPALVVDRLSVLDDGATFIRLAPGGATVLTDRALRGARPWVIDPPRRTTKSVLPPAATE
jgi:competence protein ComEC